MLAVFWRGFRPFLYSAVLFFIISYLSASTLFSFTNVLLRNGDTAASTFVLASLFAVSCLETLFLISIFFPGTTILLVFFLQQEGSVHWLILYAIVVWAGIQLGCAINYALGRLCGSWLQTLKNGAYLKRAKYITQRFANWAVLVCAWHPNMIGDLFTLQGVVALPATRLLVFSAGATAGTTAVYLICLHQVSSIAEASGITASNHYLYVSAVILIAGAVYGLWKANGTLRNGNAS